MSAALSRLSFHLIIASLPNPVNTNRRVDRKKNLVCLPGTTDPDLIRDLTGSLLTHYTDVVGSVVPHLASSAHSETIVWFSQSAGLSPPFKTISH